MPKHRIPIGVFHSLAAGGADETGTLRAGQASKRRLLLYAIQRRIETAHPGLFEAGAFAASWATLARALRSEPAGVERALLHPPVGAWGMHLLRRLHGATELQEADLDDAGYFGGLVAVALLRSGSAGEVRVRARADGTVLLPGLGRFDSAGPARWLTARLQPGSTALILTDGGKVLGVTESEDARWQPLRRLTSTSDERRIDLLLDDVDPYRAPDRLPADDRSAGQEVTHWQRHLDDAWDVLVHRHPGRAAAIASDLISVTPLRATECEPELSASSGYSFGGLALTTPRDGSSLAQAFVHEHQHIKLWALLDLVPLVDLFDDRLHYAPWRSDARPARGLLHGAYAHLGLVQFWDTERSHRRGSAGRLAHFEFARWRTAVRIVLRTLIQSGALTPAGDQFVTGMRETLAPLLAAPVPALPARFAEEAERETWTTWRLSNLRVDPNGLRDLTRAWRGGERYPPNVLIAASPVSARHGSRTSGRQRLAREQLADPNGDLEQHASGSDGLYDGDLAYARRAYAAAARHYGEAVRIAGASVDAWTGLALAHRRLNTPEALALGTRPEVVRALRDALGQEGSPSPEELARWLSTGLDRRRFDH